MNNVFTGSYDMCKAGNLISISGDRGKSVGFVGKCIPELAPKRAFWRIWHDNIGKISEEENNRYYIEEYYKQVLQNVDIEELLKEEKDPILVCFEPSNEFCHRHILAEYIEFKYGIKVYEVEVDKRLKFKVNKRPKNIGEILREVIKKYASKNRRV